MIGYNLDAGLALLPAALGPGGTFAPTLLTISGTPAAASVGSSAVFTPTIAGGSGSYTSLTVASGTLPAGRSISGLTVTGTYTTAATYSYTLRVTDSLGATADLPLTVTVSASGGAPTGFTYFMDPDGSRLTDEDGAYLMEAA